MRHDDDLLVEVRQERVDHAVATAGRGASSARRTRGSPARWPAPTPARAAAAGHRTGRARGPRRGRPGRTGPARRVRRRPAPPAVIGRRRRDSATSSTGVGMTSCASGSVNMNPTLPAHRGPVPRGVQTVHADGAGRRQDEAVEQPGERRLARPVGADDRDPVLDELEGHRPEQPDDAVRAAGRVGAVGGDEDVVERDHRGQRRERSMSGNALKIATATAAAARFFSTSPGPVHDVDGEGLAAG